MPTNVPPQYRDAEQRFRDAVTIQAKIAALQEMLQIMPKHKGTDHLKAQLRSRLSKLMSDLETSSGGKGGRTEPFSLPKEGAGRVTLIGPTNVGKSQILSSTTGARTKVGAYELSTQEPVPGMYPYSDIYIQMVDTPPITNRATQSRLYGLLRTSDIFVFVADLTNNPIAQTEESFSELPSVTLDIGKQDRSLRCNNFAMLDQDADGDQELVLSLGSPYRGFAFLDLDNQGRLVTVSYTHLTLPTKA